MIGSFGGLAGGFGTPPVLMILCKIAAEIFSFLASALTESTCRRRGRTSLLSDSTSGGVLAGLPIFVPLFLASVNPIASRFDITSSNTALKST